MSKTQRMRSAAQRRASRSQDFRCRRCGRVIGPTLSGGMHRNHCPFCLYSRHVDGEKPGDRASGCLGLMAPAGAYTRANGEHVLVHRCLTCEFERHNRIAADDDFELVLGLPRATPRKPGRVRPIGSSEESA